MRFVLNQSNLLSGIKKWPEKSLLRSVLFCIGLSWFYAICSQYCIPLPFNLVPITLQSVMFLFCAFTFEYLALWAYFAYIFQGVLGAPFFSRFGSGIGHLIGPTGGYLSGFFIAMFCMVIFKKAVKRSNFWLLLEYWFCCILYYAPGLFQLSLFVPSGKVLALGFYPFFIGDFIVKAILFLFLINKIKN